MNTTSAHDTRMAQMTFSEVYPHYVTKIEKKDRTKAELHQVIEWLTGFTEKEQQALIAEKVSFEIFFNERHCIQTRHRLPV